MNPLPPIPKKYRAHLFSGVMLIIVFAVFAVFGSRGWVQLQTLQRKQERIEALAFRLEQQNERLRKHLDRLESDDPYLEKLVRERLGWVRDGEIVYRISKSLVERSDPTGQPHGR